MCWEDASIDRELLGINEHSKIMMISSAGCNALSYLLDNPAEIRTVDINPRQTALLELKLSILDNFEYDTFAAFFWDGSCHEYQSVYEQIQDQLSPQTREFWDEHINYFSPTLRGLHFEGGCGIFARFLNSIIDRKSLRGDIIQMSSSEDRQERERIFNHIEKKLWQGAEAKIWQTNGVLSLAGIPTVQRNAIGDINQFMRTVLRQVFVDQQADKNPYWGRYLNLPTLTVPSLDYLQSENYSLLKERASRINFATTTFSESLRNSEEKFTHFVLLDHMDWMVDHDNETLEEEWRLIIKRAAPSAKMLFRTAFDHIDFIPAFATERIKLNLVDSEWLRFKDRVGTYRGTYLGEIR